MTAVIGCATRRLRTAERLWDGWIGPIGHAGARNRGGRLAGDNYRVEIMVYGWAVNEHSCFAAWPISCTAAG